MVYGSKLCLLALASFYQLYRFVSAEEMVAPWQGAGYEFEINLDDSDDSDDEDSYISDF